MPGDTKTYSGTVEMQTALVPMPPTTGVEIHHIELVQVVQDAENTVPLVADKSTVARVFVTSNISSPTGIAVTLRGRRGQQQLEAPILINGGASGAISRGDYGAAPNTARTDKAKSFNFRLPASWLAVGSIEVEAEITSIGAPFIDSSPDNNKRILGATFNTRNRFSVEYLPICVAGIPLVCPDAEGIASTPEFVNITYPVPNEGIRYQKTNAGYLEIPALPTTREQGYAILARVAKRAALMKAQDPTRMPDQLAAWIAPNNAPILGVADALWAGGGGLATYNVYQPGNLHEDSFFTLAHELAHNFGRRHVDSGADDCGADDEGSFWPHATANIYEPGWDFRTNTVVDLTKFDVMSYCSPPSSNIWIDKWTYTKLFDANGVPQKPQANGESYNILLMSGTVAANGSGASLDAPLPLVTQADPDVSDPLGTHCIRFDDTPANDFCFSPWFKDLDDQPVTLDHFVFLVPRPATFSSIKIVIRDGATLLTRTKSANAPVVQFTQPALTDDRLTGATTFTWNASDADNDALTFTLMYKTIAIGWKPLSVDITGTQATVDLSHYQGGFDTFFKIVASDGLNSSEHTVGPFNVGTLSQWGDVGCDGSLGLADVLAIRREVAGMEQPVASGCSPLGRLVTVSQRDMAITFGDFSCDGEVGAEDALLTLQVLAGMPVSSYDLCPRADTLVVVNH